MSPPLQTPPAKRALKLVRILGFGNRRELQTPPAKRALKLRAYRELLASPALQTPPAKRALKLDLVYHPCHTHAADPAR